MKKYKCRNCNSIFEGDYSTNLCPQCGSLDIHEMKSVLSPWLILVFVLTGGLGALVYLVVKLTTNK